MSNFAVKLALFFLNLSFLPAGRTSSSNAIASDCIPSIICEQVSIVKATNLCPSASELTFGFAVAYLQTLHLSLPIGRRQVSEDPEWVCPLDWEMVSLLTL